MRKRPRQADKLKEAKDSNQDIRETERHRERDSSFGKALYRSGGKFREGETRAQTGKDRQIERQTESDTAVM